MRTTITIIAPSPFRIAFFKTHLVQGEGVKLWCLFPKKFDFCYPHSKPYLASTTGIEPPT